MRKLYISVAAFFLISLTAFVYSFVYLDKDKHRTYHYVVNHDGQNIGILKLDLYLTEEKRIYKSSAEFPFDPVFNRSRSRLDLDRKYLMDSYLSESYNSDSSELIYIEKKNKAVSCLGRFMSGFIFIENMPMKNDTFIFEESSILTYFPIIENYDFKRGRSQGFNAMIPTYSNLPPEPVFMTLTSIKDEYLKVESRKIKTENMIVKIKNHPQASLWVAKSDRCPIRLDIPKKGIRITRTFSPQTFAAKDRANPVSGYVSKDVTFKSGSVELAGTLSVPSGAGPYPAVVLLSGRGPNDRDYQGLFLSISEYLSRNGFVVLRFDKRGIGSSKGDALSVCDEDEASDARSAVDYLSSCAEVDTKRILIMAHSEGAFYAIKIASADNRICALVLMAPACYPAIEREISLESMKDLGNARRWTDIYLKLITIAIRDTKDKARSSKHKWSYIMGRRCFLENWKNEIPEDMMDPVRKIKIPVFLISGKNDGEVPPNHIRLLERALKESRSPEYTIRTYSDLGHFLGNAKNDGQHRIRYEADKEMLDNIAAWFTKTVPRDTPKDAVSTPAAQ